MLQEEAPFSLVFWCRSLGLTPYEEATARAYIRQVTPPDAASEALIPPFDSRKRHASFLPSIANLMATMLGGSIISMPLAFVKCGVVLATLLMALVAILQSASLKLLCKCARQSGTNTYAEVGRVAFGSLADYTISGVLFIFLFFVLVASMVLAKDIWTPLVALVIPAVRGYQVLLGILLLSSPFLVQSTLYSLRYLCYLAIVSIVIMCAILCGQAYVSQSNLRELELVTNRIGDALVAFPIITLSFLGSFNVLYFQSALIQPTHKRINGVVTCSVGLTFVLTYMFGLMGYLFAGSATEGNILLNLNTDSAIGVAILARICCGLVMVCSMAVVIIPCRFAILELIESLHANGACPEGTDCEKEDGTNNSTRSGSQRSGPDLYVVHEGSALLPPIEEDEEQECFMIGNPYAHYGSTVCILGFCFLGAMKAPNVAMLWSFCGPFLAFMISFFFPAACYLEIQRREPNSNEQVIWSLFSWFLIMFSIVASIACTFQTICTSFVWSMDGGGVVRLACSEQQTILWLPCSS